MRRYMAAKPMKRFQKGLGGMSKECREEEGE